MNFVKILQKKGKRELYQSIGIKNLQISSKHKKPVNFVKKKNAEKLHFSQQITGKGVKFVRVTI